MEKNIFVNCDNKETRVAVQEDGHLVEIYLERPVHQRVVGNIYNGVVENVLPGMQAAFVNIGLERNAFLYVDDAYLQKEGGEKPSIKEILSPGEEILVQVVKEPFGSKGARLTRQITIPGRYLVLMPTVDYIGISRRIEDSQERDRLKSITEKIRPDSTGVIVRTVAQGTEEISLEQDMDFLTKIWARIKSKMDKMKSPALIHQDLDLIYRIVRDLFTGNINKFVIDTSFEYEKVIEALDFIAPSLKEKVHFYREEEPIFKYFDIEKEIEKALSRKVWLQSGGYLVIDQTEALTVIDVNTGKYIGKTNLADTILKTNLEAAEEIIRHVRLRDIGGIIIIDFIDMSREEDQNAVLERLEEKLKADRTRSHVLGLTSLGLVEMTRKKVRQGIDDFLQQECPYCSGKGKVLTGEVVSSRIEREIKEILTREKAEAILIEVHYTVAALLIGSNGLYLKKLEEETRKNIFIRGSDFIHIEKFLVLKTGTLEEVQKQAYPVEVGQKYRVKIEELHTNNPYDGIARVSGFVLDVHGGGAYVGETVEVEVQEISRTYAKAKICSNN